MIIIRLSGGLGNQLFQYALARKFKEKGNADIKIDASYLRPSKQDMVTRREFLLDNFNITLKVLNSAGVLMRKIKTNLSRIMKTIYDPKQFGYDKSVFDCKDNCFLAGNWANPQYFDDIKPVLLREITLKNALSDKTEKILEMINNSESVSIHIRRGDYVNYQNKFILLPMEYYERAIGIIRGKVRNPAFFIFSDEIEYAKDNLKAILGEKFFYVSGDEINEYEELMLMSRCEHNIIANSTFSWWGAYLNQNDGKIIIAPKKFRKDGIDESGLIPDEFGWIKI
ncbi:MAG: glycosyl transferase family 11 [Parcubacteria group bacterium]|nr:glycosyl transferase family 11 [Parcubacteria group bacterium]